jgi:hypothetical protein
MVIVNQGISIFEQAMEKALSRRLAQVEGDAVLVGVQIEKQTALLRVRDVSGVGATLPGLVSSNGLFNFDHFRSHIGHQLGRIGGGHQVPTFKDAYTFQGAFCHAFLRLVRARTVALHERSGYGKPL